MHKKFTLATTLFLVAISLSLAGCRSTNHLKGYDFEGANVAVMAAIPPNPQVFTDLWYDARFDLRHPIISILRVGSAVAKQIEADKAQARLDSALQYIDVSERLARRTLVGASRYLGYRPVDHLRGADFIMDVQIRDYGIAADSWQSEVSLIIEGEVILLDNISKKPIWRERLNISERVSPRIFGIASGGAGNVFTAATLAGLSVEEMITGFNNLADLSADLIVLELRDDYYRTR